MRMSKGLVFGLTVALALLAQPGPEPAASLVWRDFSARQIERLVAPVALYPDALLAQILVAATYPDDVEEAARWRRRNDDLSGRDLEYAAQRRPWDESVKSLLHFPGVLQRMDDDPDWTEDLGVAFLRQEDEVMDAVQRLRRDAWEAGNLRSTSQQLIYRDGDIIVIQSADPRVVYVPTYDSRTVYIRDYGPGAVNFGFGAVVGGLLTAAILWDDDYGHRGHSHVYYHGPGRWNDRGYWHRDDYRRGGWRRPPHDMRPWNPRPDRPDHRPGRPDYPGNRPDRPDRPDYPGNRPGRPDRPDYPGTRPDRPDYPGNRPDRPDRPDRPGTRPDRPNRPDHPGQYPSVRPNQRLEDLRQHRLQWEEAPSSAPAGRPESSWRDAGGGRPTPPPAVIHRAQQSAPPPAPEPRPEGSNTQQRWQSGSSAQGGEGGSGGQGWQRRQGLPGGE